MVFTECKQSQTLQAETLSMLWEGKGRLFQQRLLMCTEVVIFTPLLVFALKQISIIKLYTNNRSEKNNHIFSVLACVSPGAFAEPAYC